MEEKKMAFCGKCGSKINDSAKFCPHCGATADEAPQTPKAPSAPKSVPYAAAAASVAESARDRLLPLLKRHYKAIGIALLALLVLTQLSRCAGGGKEDKLLDQLRGSWSMQTQVYGDAATQVNRPWDIYISEHSIQLGGLGACPLSDVEHKKDALYFPAQWYDSDPGNGREPGMQDYELRLIYSKSDDLLTLEVKVSNKWYGLGEYARK